jgi:hypothetical protein
MPTCEVQATFSQGKRKETTRQLSKSWLHSHAHYVLCVYKLTRYKAVSVRPSINQLVRAPLAAWLVCTIYSRSNMNNDGCGGLSCMMIIVLFLAASSSTTVCKLHLSDHLLFFSLNLSLSLYTTCWWTDLLGRCRGRRPHPLEVRTVRSHAYSLMRVSSNATTLNESKFTLIFCQKEDCYAKPEKVKSALQHLKGDCYVLSVTEPGGLAGAVAPPKHSKFPLIPI